MDAEADPVQQFLDAARACDGLAKDELCSLLTALAARWEIPSQAMRMEALIQMVMSPAETATVRARARAMVKDGCPCEHCKRFAAGKGAPHAS